MLGVSHITWLSGREAGLSICRSSEVPGSYWKRVGVVRLGNPQPSTKIEVASRHTIFVLPAAIFLIDS